MYHIFQFLIQLELYFSFPSISAQRDPLVMLYGSPLVDLITALLGVLAQERPDAVPSSYARALVSVIHRLRCCQRLTSSRFIAMP